ncbi:response regulator [Gracilibacillus oryzae]|uniref:Response regulator n=1 Tax=Gracilibacillus oryzae TaxID=1672701 RepID=A0A7C8GQM4_9BACI|nr:response regulator [Gracilibacillus oryzae]KAB8125923.1 response regulator [Gracilibacillus oryzae]
MRNVLIVDDEVQIRKGLQWKIDWEDEGFQIAAEAGNGEEALSLIEKNRIDLVMTDVRMPRIDGIELAKECKKHYPDTKVIVLSGYSDFEYVKDSMKGGVRDYLLKPVDPEELREVLSRMKDEIDQEKRKQLELAKLKRIVRTQLQEVQEQALLSLVKEEWLQHSVVVEKLKLTRLNSFLQANVKAQFISVEIRDIKGKSQRVNELRATFQMLCKEIAESKSHLFAFYDPNYTNMMQFLLLIKADGLDSSTQIAKTIQHNVKKLLKLETVIGIGYVVKGLSEFKTGYISSLLSWSQSQLGTHSEIVDETVKKEWFANFPPELEKKITNAIEQTNMEKFELELNMFLGEKTKQSVFSFSIGANRILFSLVSVAKKYNMETKNIERLIWESQQAIWELNAHKKVVDCLVQLADMIIERVRNTRITDGKLIVEGVRRYIDQHYGSDLSLTILSELFHINSAYLSEIFKVQIGRNFSEYLVDRRMKEARKFLEDEHLKIIDVANLVGFSSSAYFSTVFKKHNGQSPIEFRRSTGIK